LVRTRPTLPVPDRGLALLTRHHRSEPTLRKSEKGQLASLTSARDAGSTRDLPTSDSWRAANVRSWRDLAIVRLAAGGGKADYRNSGGGWRADVRAGRSGSRAVKYQAVPRSGDRLTCHLPIPAGERNSEAATYGALEINCPPGEALASRYVEDAPDGMAAFDHANDVDCAGSFLTYFLSHDLNTARGVE
jgi:hypothetical protein